MYRIFRLSGALVVAAWFWLAPTYNQVRAATWNVAQCTINAPCDQGVAYAACWAQIDAYKAANPTRIYSNERCEDNGVNAITPRFSSTNATGGNGFTSAGQSERYVAKCTSRGDEYNWMPPGGTVGEAVCYQGCTYNFILDAGPQGNFFSPSGATCRNSDHPAPQVDTDGDGVPDTEDAFPNDPNESQDTDGDGIGDNADHSPDDPTNGEDDGDGNESDNTATGGADCNAPPACKGDGIACNTNYQVWKHRCETWGNVTGDPTVCNAAYSCVGNPHQCAQIALLRKTACSNALTGNIDSDGDGFGLGDKGNLQAIKDAVTAESVDAGDAPDMPFVDGAGEGHTWSSGLGGGSCPAPISRTVTIGGYSQAIEFSFGPICEFSLLINGIVLLGSAIVSAYIISGVRK